MAKKWLSVVNFSIGGLGIFLLLAAGGVIFARPHEIPVPDFASIKAPLPRGSFVQQKDAYDAIKEPLFSLAFSPMTIQLPDLRKTLMFYGKNGRPDAKLDRPLIYFAFIGNKTPSSISPGEKLYILYDKKQTPAQYVFSPENKETHLWLEATVNGNEAVVKVGMNNENGEIIKEPSSYAQFSLTEKEYVRVGAAVWEIGKWRVDGSLFARQKARWFGSDRFLERHGGDEYHDLMGKQRIDFGEGEDIYSVYVGLHDILIWENDRWVVAKPGPESLGRPLIAVKKIDDRLMNLELWDVDGKAKMALNLLKSAESWMPQNLQQSFKFVGARTRSQFVFEINKERMLLSPQDWLVLTETGWKKLTTAEEIDEYVNRKLTGPLFVFDGITRKDDRQVLMGTMFNPSRTDMQSIELPVIAGTSSPTPLEKGIERLKQATENPQTPFAKSRAKIESASEDSHDSL